MNNIEKIRTLQAGFEAACRWLYPGTDMCQHVRGRITAQELSKDNYGEEYVADVMAIRQALAVKEGETHGNVHPVFREILRGIDKGDGRLTCAKS